MIRLKSFSWNCTRTGIVQEPEAGLPNEKFVEPGENFGFCPAQQGKTSPGKI